MIVRCLALAFIGMASIGSANAAEINSFDLSGYFDGYYGYNWNRPSPVTPPSSASASALAVPSANNSYRYYDAYHNQFTLSLAELTVKARKDDVSFLADLDFGTFADLNAASSSSSGTAVDEVSKHIGQAVVSYRPSSTPRFVFDFGKMYTHVGLETAKPKDNWNYSRSILFSYGMPFWHVGVRAGFDAIPDKLSTSLFVYNSWNSIYDNNSGKTWGAQLKYSLTPQSSITYNFIGGPEQARNEKAWKTVHELNALILVAADWQLGVDFLTGSEENVSINNRPSKPHWYGGSTAIRYQLTPKSYLSPRYEIYRDQHGYTLSGPPQTVHSATFTYGHALTDSISTRAEFKREKSDEAVFRTGATGLKKSQSTLLAALLFQF